MAERVHGHSLIGIQMANEILDTVFGARKTVVHAVAGIEQNENATAD